MQLFFGPLLADLAALGNPGTTVANNVIPVRGTQPGSVGYRPFRSPEVASEAFAARVQGVIAVRDTSGNVNVFVGSAAKLERLSSSDTTPEDVSISGGYSTPADELWNFAFDGKSRVIAMNGPTGDDIQTYVLGSSTDFAVLSADAPKARAGAYVKEALMLVNTNDGTNGHQPNGVRWSKRGDATTFDDVGTAPAIAGESDERLLNGNFGPCTGIKAGLPGVDGLIWQETALWRVGYVGGDQFYAFDLMEGSKGTLAPGSIVGIPGRYAYLGGDGFYVTDGLTTSPIGSDRIDKTFFDEVDQGNFPRVSGIADPINKVVIWSYPASGNLGVPNRLVLWNWSTGDWAFCPGIGDHELLVSSMAVGYSLEDLDSIYPSLDAMVVSLDSRTLTGGQLLLGAMNTSHKFATFTGTALAAKITTGEVEPIPGRRSSVTRARPLVDGTDATVTLTPITRNKQNENATTGTASSPGDDGSCPLRTNARYQRVQVDIAAGGTWTQALGVEVPDDAVKNMGAR